MSSNFRRSQPTLANDDSFLSNGAELPTITSVKVSSPGLNRRVELLSYLKLLDPKPLVGICFKTVICNKFYFEVSFTSSNVCSRCSWKKINSSLDEGPMLVPISLITLKIFSSYHLNKATFESRNIAVISYDASRAAWKRKFILEFKRHRISVKKIGFEST